MTSSVDDYYLHVDILVPEQKHKEYERLLSLFVEPEFPFLRYSKRADYTLELALCSKPFVFSPGLTALTRGSKFLKSTNAQADTFFPKSAKPRVRKYVHLWRVPQIQDLALAELMRAVADDDLYMSINALVLREVQTFVRRVRLPTLPITSVDGKYLRVTRRFNGRDIGTYLFNAGVLEPTLRQAGWHLQGQYQNVTGALNLVTEFWKIPDHDDGSRASLLKRFEPVKLAQPRAYDELVTKTLELVQAETREPLTVCPYFKQRPA